MAKIVRFYEASGVLEITHETGWTAEVMRVELTPDAARGLAEQLLAFWLVSTKYPQLNGADSDVLDGVAEEVEGLRQLLHELQQRRA